MPIGLVAPIGSWFDIDTDSWVPASIHAPTCSSRAAAIGSRPNLATLVQPKPLLRALTDPRLQDCIDLGHQRGGVGVRLTTTRQRQWRRGRDAKACPIEALNPDWQHVAVKAERQNNEGGRSHRQSPEEGYRDPVIHLPIREQGQVPAAAQRRNRAPRANGSLRNEFAALAAEPRDHAIRQRRPYPEPGSSAGPWCRRRYSCRSGRSRR
jgi:hypothetical protein